MGETDTGTPPESNGSPFHWKGVVAAVLTAVVATLIANYVWKQIDPEPPPPQKTADIFVVDWRVNEDSEAGPGYATIDVTNQGERAADLCTAHWVYARSSTELGTSEVFGLGPNDKIRITVRHQYGTILQQVDPDELKYPLTDTLVYIQCRGIRYGNSSIITSPIASF